MIFQFSLNCYAPIHTAFLQNLPRNAIDNIQIGLQITGTTAQWAMHKIGQHTAIMYYCRWAAHSSTKWSHLMPAPDTHSPLIKQCIHDARLKRAKRWETERRDGGQEMAEGKKSIRECSGSCTCAAHMCVCVLVWAWTARNGQFENWYVPRIVCRSSYAEKPSPEFIDHNF